MNKAHILEACRTSTLVYRQVLPTNPKYTPIQNRNQMEALVYNGKHSALHISFRGTCNYSDLCKVLDLRWRKLRPHDMYVHNGFYDKFLEIEKYITPIIENNKDIHIVFSGHSMGGSVAMIAAYFYHNVKQVSNPISCNTFGAPQTGNKRFIEALSNRLYDLNCISLEKDIIPRIPLNPMLSNMENITVTLKDPNDVPFWNVLENHSCASYMNVITFYDVI